MLLGMLFYYYYLDGDTIRYYQESSRLVGLNLSDFFDALTKPVERSQPFRAIYFTRLVALIQWLTHGDYWILSAYFSMFSFLGSFYLSNKLVLWRRSLKIPSILAFLFFPSTVFWSSGLLKESLVFGALTFLIGVYFSWIQNRKLHIGHLSIGIISLFIIISFKYYVAAVLMPLLLYQILYHQINWKNWKMEGIWKRSMCLAVMLTIPALLLFNWMSVNLSYERLWPIMKKNHDLYIQMAPDGAIHTLSWFDNAWDILINMPFLWFSGIFRPLVGEDFTFPAALSGLENLLLLTGVILGIFSWIKNKIIWTPELLSVLIYISTLSIFLCYSTPNFGTLARFKVYYIPFVVLLITHQLQSLSIFRKN